MHVFIDTNIILSFLHFSKDDLDALQNVFASHTHGSASIHLTQQVCDEFKRNRENRIKDALKRFKDNKFSAQLPSFMKPYSEYDEIRELSSKLQKKQKDILVKVDQEVTEQNLLADKLIKEIFDKSDIIETSREIYDLASMRMSIGNPPGKNSSIGDAINWIILLDVVPNGENLHVISEDGDFYSSINEISPHPFLQEEWSEKKGSELVVYRKLSEFMKEHFDGVAFSFDKNKEALFDELMNAGSFSRTHGIISRLEEYSYFSLKEVCKILDGASENDQFGSIITDYDVSDFLNRIAVPRLGELISDKHKQIVQYVIDEQKER
ncbi:PIN domain-containing protein [Kiloniella sp. EL199]|uniref:PIN domain-containing protein n=1 Tax=Kiloniella sp. EL199 TaxID=2107581 RepID=UPI000EA37108|nr:PIN domain-containing protein [Kiloniella sp. EL199]